ncbi:MAG: putative beta-barrel porin-2, OmpL-like, partial [Verrucomicrobiota bacterium]
DSSYANAVSGYISYQLTEKLKLNNRVEYATSSGNVFLPGNINDERVFALTSTLDYALFANVVTRAEARWDTAIGGSNLRPFDGEKNDVSLTLNVIYKF